MLAKELETLLAAEKPDKVALEKLFFFKNKKTVIAVAQARGVIAEAVLSRSIPLEEYTPLQVKSAVSAYGRAGKKEVQKMMRLLLHLSEDPQPDDAADALALAVCSSTYNHSLR
jgi:crossover junction endodeoxyribonuclease RuvC